MAAKINMHQFVLERLGHNKAEWERAAEGSGVSFYTILKIATGKTKEPGVLKIQKLYDFYERRATP